ncbi:N/A [soil metagenome]
MTATAASPTTERSMIGRMIGGRFRVVAPLGEGGMGIVVAAETSTHQRVAIKLLRREMLDERDVKSRFLDEAASTKRIHHKNVLRVFEAGTTEDGVPYIVMEHLDGTALSTLMQSGGRVPPAAAVPILRGVLAGLAAAHAVGVVHRDLKPENVFLERSTTGAPGGYEVKLLDFGIAKVMDAAGGMGNRTKTGMLLGTPAYMSPEQLRNSKEADARTDLWAAGVLFYEMLCDRHPFPAPTEFGRLAVILNQPPEPLDDVALPFASLIERALAKNKDARFASADDMLAALAQAPTSVVRPVTAPMSSVPSTGPGARSYEAAAFSSTALNPSIQQPAIQRIHEPSDAGPGGTLTSRPSNAGPEGGATLSSGAAFPRHMAPPLVVMVPPSAPVEAPRARGLAPAIVVAFVGFALIIGFVLGLAVGRLQ